MKKKKTSRALPSTADLIRSTRSALALAAIIRSGGGKHQDKRRAKGRRRDWEDEVWWI